MIFFVVKYLIFLALADAATQRASWLVKRGKGGLGDVDIKIQLLLQKKITRLDFFVTFFINEKK
ncbi:hypothetical protein [Lutibacter sp.]|uniref:hypothetical protein n=1 Tax=Lutibacter sp. TaxID=1925666 RepID=UPI003564D0C5